MQDKRYLLNSLFSDYKFLKIVSPIVNQIFTGQFTRQSMVGSEGICAAMKQLYQEMDKTSESVTPLVMLKVMHMTFPRFAERGEGGVFQQQVNISNR